MRAEVCRPSPLQLGAEPLLRSSMNRHIQTSAPNETDFFGQIHWIGELLYMCVYVVVFIILRDRRPNGELFGPVRKVLVIREHLPAAGKIPALAPSTTSKVGVG